MKNVGIWIDKSKALLVELQEGDERVYTIESEVEDFHVTGGSRSKTRWGPQDVVQDSKYTEREKHQLQRYFEDISNALNEADAIAIFGPADTNLKLEQYLRKHNKELASRIRAVEKADSMTQNQVKALVKKAFA